MPRIEMQLEEQLSDTRSNEVAYRLRIENLGATPVSILGVTPRMPDGVELLEVKDSSAQAIKIQHDRLCNELTRILRDYLLTSSKEIQQRLFEIQKSQFKEIISSVAGTFWRVYFGAISGLLYKRLKYFSEQRRSFGFEINGKADADIALQKWFNEDKAGSSLNELFRAKCMQLERIEHEMGTDPSRESVAIIEPDSFFATTYILQFPRSYINPRKFSFSVEASISESESGSTQLLAATATVGISPKPYFLSLITVFAALLGTALKFTLEPKKAEDTGIFLINLGKYLVTGPGITGSILSLVVYNVYEYLDVGDNIKMRVGWRSALLVGVLCGLFSDRMIAALKALVGV